MTMSPTFESFSQNGEDVVLWRALRSVEAGRYIDVGANHPSYYSVTKAFYDLGWSGLTIEPMPEMASLQRQQRPRDFCIEAIASDVDGGSAPFHAIAGTGLSTMIESIARRHTSAGYETKTIPVSRRRIDCILDELGWQGEEIHFMSVDVEGSERSTLAGANLSLWRPWIVVVESTSPTQRHQTHHLWEDLLEDAEYSLTMFDGLSRWYVSKEKLPELKVNTSYPACPLDNYSTEFQRSAADREQELQVYIDRLIVDTAKWRSKAVDYRLSLESIISENQRIRGLLEKKLFDADDALAQQKAVNRDLRTDNASLRAAVQELQNSTSWRVTIPLRRAKDLLRSGFVGNRG